MKNKLLLEDILCCEVKRTSSRLLSIFCGLLTLPGPIYLLETLYEPMECKHFCFYFLSGSFQVWRFQVWLHLVGLAQGRSHAQS